jgi:hypothetical protein
VKTVIVYGPMACGKTRNAMRIAAYFNINTIVDDWDVSRHQITFGAIHLTNIPPHNAPIRCFNFTDLKLPPVGLISTMMVAPTFINRFHAVDRRTKGGAA